MSLPTDYNLAPIAFFVYNRPRQTAKTLAALKENILAGDSILYVFCDGPKEDASKEHIERINEVRQLVKNTTGFKDVIIIEQVKNNGLANSIINGVTEIVNNHGKVIVLEDDLVSSRYFLTYMNEGLRLYENNKKVISLHGYIYPIKTKINKCFFIKGADCWGWATWKRGWEMFESDGQKLLKELKSKGLTNEFDFDNSYPYTKMLEDQIAKRNNSWAIRWYASAFLAGKLTLYPNVSYIQNIGMDNSGTHSGKTTAFDVDLATSYSADSIVTEAEESIEGRKAITAYFDSFKPSPLKIFIKKLLFKN